MPEFTVESIVIEECKRPIFLDRLAAYAKRFADYRNKKKEETNND